MPVSHSDPSPPFEPLSRSQILLGMGVTAFLWMVVAKLWMHLGAIALFPIALTLPALLWGLGLGLSITLASTGVYHLWRQYRRNADEYLTFVLKPLVWLDLIWLGLLPGMSEELLFRGVMLPAFGFNWEAVVLSSICFGVLHLSNPRQWAYVLWATLIGGVLATSALVSDNLLVPIVAHSLTNLVSSAIWKWRDRP
jgi:uncharacterized protein